MDHALKVYTGLWYDPRQGRVWTIDEGWYIFATSVIGVCFGLAQPCVERVLTHLFGWIHYGYQRLRKRPLQGSNQAHDDRTPLLPRASPASPRKTRLSPLNCCSNLPARDVVAKVLSGLVLLASIAYAVAGSFVTSVPSEKAALSGSRTCGLWSLRDDANGVAQDADAMLQGEKETRSGLYARDCYGAQTSTGLDECMLFRQRKIDSTVEKGQECPFANKTYCASTGFTAVRFSTDQANARNIGVKVQDPPRLNRTSICVPLDLNAGFVARLSRANGHWGYDLGPVYSDEYSSNYTFTQYGDPFEYDVRAYTMSTYRHVYSKTPSQNYWQPIPALDIREDLNTQSTAYSLTLMFINSCRIFYKENSDDSIFPADRRYKDTELWTNNDSRARPLACVDWVEICDHNGLCMPSHQAVEDEDPAHLLTRLAMNKSTIFDAISSRGATGLDAQNKIRDDISMPLSKDPTQWVEESQALFHTSLARMQYEALDIANGTGRDKEPMYRSQLPDEIQQKLCGIVTFQLPKGYENIRIGPTIAFLIIPLLFWQMAVQTQKDFSEKRKQSGCFDGLKLIRAERVPWKLWEFLRSCFKPSELPDQGASSSEAAVSAGSSAPQTGNSNGRTYGTGGAPTAPQPAALSAALATQSTPPPQQPTSSSSNLVNRQTRPAARRHSSAA